MPTPEQRDILEAIADAAAELVVLMPDEAAIVRPALTADGLGGRLAADVPLATSVPCRVKALTGRELATAAAVAAEATYAVTVPVGTDVHVTDALLTRGRRFEVVFVPDNTYAAQIRTLCSVAGVTP